MGNVEIEGVSDRNILFPCFVLLFSTLYVTLLPLSLPPPSSPFTLSLPSLHPLSSFIELAKRILDDFVRDVASDSGRKLPSDGTVHETTSNVLSFMTHVNEYSEVKRRRRGRRRGRQRQKEREVEGEGSRRRERERERERGRVMNRK